MTENTNSHKRPIRVLASYLMDAPTASQSYSDELHALACNAGRAVSNVAADVQLIFVNALQPGADAAQLLRGVDGVLLLGGADVEPTLFTDDPEIIKHSVETNPEADKFEIEIAKQASDMGLPVLGICRGAQVINVAFGGTLITELGKDTMHRGANGEEWSDHSVEIKKETRLHKIYGTDSVLVRSSHHQAVDQVAQGFEVVSTAADGVIEAIEAVDDRWILAVQWHPEDLYGNPEHLAKLAGALVEESRKVNKTRLNG